jgi:hypothetical protein
MFTHPRRLPYDAMGSSRKHRSALEAFFWHDRVDHHHKLSLDLCPDDRSSETNQVRDPKDSSLSFYNIWIGSLLS